MDDSSATSGGVLRSWGNLTAPGVEVRAERLDRLPPALPLSRGLGRSYGDSSLPAKGDERVAGTVLADRILAFDRRTGRIRVEAGLSLAGLNRVTMPRRWFTPVSPGTKFVTVGGMVASDVHGKNHHVAGCFGRHVRELLLRTADGRAVACSRDAERDLFLATVGGMGLTGHILEVEFDLERIPSPWIVMESERVPDVGAFVRALDAAKADWPFTMGWIDCLARGAAAGRGILMVGRWATPDEAPRHDPRPRRKLAVPFTLPGWVLNRATARAFNELYYGRHPGRRRRAVVHPDAFFYPLDAVHDWNRVYGPRGFFQYQCVLPTAAGPDAARRFLDVLGTAGGVSPLCVIKDCGEASDAPLSFPVPGISIAVDMAITDDSQRIVDRLNDFVVQCGGRVYLTKDAFTRPEHFRTMMPRLDEWLAVRRRWDPQGRLRSRQSVRVLGDAT